MIEEGTVQRKPRRAKDSKVLMGFWFLYTSKLRQVTRLRSSE